MSVLDTRREALDAQAVAHSVALDGVRILAATTPPTPAAATFDLSAGVVVVSPRKQDVARQIDLDGGATAADTTKAIHAVVYFSPSLGAFLFAAVPGTAIAFTGAELPVYPTDAEVAAALPPEVPDDGWTLAGTIIARNVAGTMTLIVDESTRSFGVDPDGTLSAALRVLTEPPAPSLVIPDPGAAGAIPVDRSGSVAMVSAGVETRTVAIPTFVGQTLSLFHSVDGGSIAITFAAAINQAGNATATFTEVADFLTLEAVDLGGVLRWRVVANDGVVLSA